ncbi:MAG: amino acid ABC transporter permease [Ruminococcus sp.]|nr:amino acid ABC transporter permease [Ruminococcus sp.]MCM1381447.1 amino acid ABC transporter permease [Muribaculaceae bacterium]MCM1479266.1 amino acid ABC transporter permease [Muribaculaceae bacterium]
MAEWFDKLKNRFYLNFIMDDRWQYITRGLWTTVRITFFAVLLGIVIGFLIAVIRSTCDKTGKLKIPNFICRVYLTVIRGTPVVVQLLIIYFVIFGSVNINKMIVAVIAFGINSGAYVAEIVRSGIMSIDKGQFEAGRSLGFNYVQTMAYIVMPQAFKNVLPALGNELIVLLKETSVSGYIAMEDLTKGGDIIRSRTYDAMMPLLAVAVIYLAIVMLLEFAVGRLERRLRNSDH